MRRSHFITALAVVLCTASVTATAQPRPKTIVFLNGVRTPVHFSDGDTFKPLTGPMKGVNGRLKGFNTLESYGPCHLWGTWTMRELENYATLGTLNAQKGVWHCTGNTNERKGGFGRMLWDCPDLAVDQVRKGYAHGMTVTMDPATPPLVAAQKEAMAARRGMWAHGIPKWVVTSLHSAAEGRGKPYNRLISSADGHSEKWLHHHTYRECQSVCRPTGDAVVPDRVAALVAELRVGSSAAEYKAYTNEELGTLITAIGTEGYIQAGLEDESRRWQFETPIARAVAAGRLSAGGEPTSCMVYVMFQRRYGEGRPECLH